MQKLKLFFSLFLQLIFFLTLSSGFIVAASEVNPKPQYGGEYRAPLLLEPSTLDPALYTDIYSMSVAMNLFDGLVEFDQALNVVPAIAKRWKISRDHRTYTFQLRKGVKFHNGREVTAEDFVFSFTRLLDPALKSSVASFFLNIKGAKAFHEGHSSTIEGLQATQSHILKIELEEPFAPFLSILSIANAKVVPREVLGPEFARHPIGTGPFRLSAWKSGEEIVLEANHDYFAGRPYLDTLNFYIYPNDQWEQTYDDFQKGKIEHTRIPKSQYHKITSNTIDLTHQVISNSGLNLVYIGINTTIKPFDDKRIRHAINYAVDTDSIVKNITKRGTTTAKGILPPGVAGYDPNFEGYGYDPAKARDLLAAAGYPNGQGFPTIELWTASKAQSVQAELREYQRYLANVGLKTVIKVADSWKNFVQAIKTQKASLYYAAWYADYPDPDNFLYPLVYSGSKVNRMGFRNTEIDQLLHAARTEMDYIKRTQIYRDIEKLVIQSAPMVTQHTNSNSYLFSKKAKGLDMSHLGLVYLPFRNVWLDR